MRLDDLRYVRSVMETHYLNLITPPATFRAGRPQSAPADSPLYAERKRVHDGLTALIVEAGGDEEDAPTP